MLMLSSSTCKCKHWQSLTQSKVIAMLNRLDRYIPASALLLIFNSLVYSYINYCIFAWRFSCEQISLLQKKAVRLMCSEKFNAHTDPLLKKITSLKWLRFSSWDQLSFIIDMWKVNYRNTLAIYIQLLYRFILTLPEIEKMFLLLGPPILPLKNV